MLARPGVARRRPGLLGTMARTAVVAGTASATVGAVRGRQAHRQQQAAQQAVAEQTTAGATGTPPAATRSAPGDLAASLRQLTELNAAGALSDAEFAAAKAKLLGT